MDNAYATNIYGMKPVANVCDQILREIGSVLPVVSMAHVIMEHENVSLMHKHTHMTEIYYILDGKGILYNGDMALEVEKNACVVIDPGKNHKLKNIGEGRLEHLVFACPPFDPNDIVLYEGEDNENGENSGNSENGKDDDSKYKVEKFVFDKKAIEAQDGAIVYELLDEAAQYILGIQIARGVLPARRTATKHYHKMSHEVYYVISGKGRVHLDNKSSAKIGKGSYVNVPVGREHALQNTSDEELEVLCLSTPPFKAEDFLKK